MLMKPVQSRITRQGQISVPSKVRRALGVGPGAVLEWETHPDGYVVRRAGRVTTLDIHKLIADHLPATATARPVDVKAAITRYIRHRQAHARD